MQNISSFYLIDLFICHLLLDIMRDTTIIKICSGSLNMLYFFYFFLTEQFIDENSLASPCYKLFSLITPEKSKLLKHH